ncbi:hypothetical protein HDU96_009744 [Phlyctochytrium bullatum]|nr:hypothetical protein HDU96_009744 [Phlyctochytrium bullatum]
MVSVERSKSSLAASQAEETPLATAFWGAVADGDVETLKSILPAKPTVVNLVKNGATALHIASTQNNVAMVSLLLEYGADCNRRNAQDKLPIQLSSSVAVWKVLATKMRPATKTLWRALTDGKDDGVAVRLILAAQQNPTAAASKIYAEEGKEVVPLHLAAFGGSLEVARALLDCGAAVDSRDGTGNTALHLAASRGHFALAQCLVEMGAQVTEKTPDGWTPLHDAAGIGHLPMVQWLVASGADINAKASTDDSTPVQCAATKQCLPVVAWLLMNGAVAEAKEGQPYMLISVQKIADL